MSPPAQNVVSITELARAKWRASAIDDDWAATLRLEALHRDKVRGLGATFKHAGALKIPYFDAAGRTTSFFRIRYLEPLPGFAGVSVKPQRYAQSHGSVSEVYLPPVYGELTWAEILANPESDLCITEGELKAASACLHGLTTIGLGGVDVWRSSKRGLPMLPTLDSTEWKNRAVYVIYDSDAASNQNVLRAQHQLADELVARGARVRIVSLPAGPNGAKQGLDDFIVARGAEAERELQELLGRTPGLAESRALWEMSEEVVYARDPGLIVVRATGDKLRPEAFMAHSFANRHYWEEKVTKDGVKMTKKPLAPHWIAWEARAEVSRVTYAPGLPQVTGDGAWNDWPGWGCEPEPGDVSPWSWLLDYLFRGKTPEREWFERWVAYPIQHPGTKLLSSAVIWGVAQGTGKTLAGHTLLRIYGKNGVEIDDSDLEGNFNSWSLNKQFVMGDEITGSDSRARANRLKNMITRQQYTVKVKYIPEYTLPDCVNYLWTSNGPDAFFLDNEDRRYFIHEIVGDPAPLEKYRWYDRWLKSPAGPSALFAHLLTLDLGDFDPAAPAMKTEARSAMIADGRSDIAAWCAALRAEPERVLQVLGARAAAECDLLTASQLLTAYDPTGDKRVTATGLGRELKRQRFRSFSVNAVSTTAGLQRLVVVRRPDKWAGAPLRDGAAHWDSYFGAESKRF